MAFKLLELSTSGPTVFRARPDQTSTKCLNRRICPLRTSCKASQDRPACSTHWSDIHQMLLNGLPDPSIVKFSHRVLDFQQPQGSTRVHVVVAKGGKEDPSEHVELKADLMVAADGSMSNTRAKFRPDEKRRCTPEGNLAHCHCSSLWVGKSFRPPPGLTVLSTTWCPVQGQPGDLPVA